MQFMLIDLVLQCVLQLSLTPFKTTTRNIAITREWN